MTATTPARRGPGPKDDLAGITFRYATDDDLPECGRIHREAIDGYLVPMNVPPLPPENQSLLRLHAHTRATSPERFLVAERRKRLGRPRIVAFGSAIDREHLWFLSMLFVEPGEQARGLGKALLDRILPRDRDGWTLATCTDAAQPISNGLYAAYGIVPRMPFFNVVGRPGPGWTAPPLPDGVTATRVEPSAEGAIEPAVQKELDELDRSLIGVAHPEDHRYDLRERPWLFAYRDGSGRLVGYGYTGEVGRIGPLAVVDRALEAPVLGHLLTAVEPRGASAVWLPGDGDGAFETALQAGLRVEGFPTLLCFDRPFGDFTRYVPTSPGLI
jgi:GNAT superfamily N-acetyltransferase